MSLRRRWKRFKILFFLRVYHCSKNSISLEKVTGVFVVACIIFIFSCNHFLENPLPLKSVDVSHFSISAGTLRLPQNDIRIVKHIQKRFLIPRPYLRKKETNKLFFTTKPPKVTAFVLKLLKNQKNGFFVEYPAKDGLLDSQTIVLEKRHNWTGLLIEHDINYTKRLKEMERFSWISTACLSSNKYPKSEKHTRRSYHNQSEIATLDYRLKFNTDEVGKSYSAQCFPLYSILVALNVTKVDYLSLHLAIPEVQLAILKTIPFNKVAIKVISVDVEATTKAYRDTFLFVTSKGYIMPRYIKKTSNNETSSQIYIHSSINYF